MSHCDFRITFHYRRPFPDVKFFIWASKIWWAVDFETIEKLREVYPHHCVVTLKRHSGKKSGNQINA